MRGGIDWRAFRPLQAAETVVAGIGAASTPVLIAFNLEIGAPTLFVLVAESSTWLLVSWHAPYAIAGVDYLDYSINVVDYGVVPARRSRVASLLAMNVTMYNVSGLSSLHNYAVEVLVRNNTNGFIGT